MKELSRLSETSEKICTLKAIATSVQQFATDMQFATDINMQERNQTSGKEVSQTSAELVEKQVIKLNSDLKSSTLNFPWLLHLK